VSSLTRLWPHDAFEGVAHPAAALRMATAVRSAVQVQHAKTAPLRSLDGVLRLGRFAVAETELSSARGMQEGLLIPVADDCFAISVDPTPRGGWARIPAGLRLSLHRHRLRFRIAHEIAHSFFYARSRGETPTRVLRGSPAEESFCDEFARALLVPPAAVRQFPASARSILQLHRIFDVSMEVAARAFAAAADQATSVALWYRAAPEREFELQWSNRRPAGLAAPLVPGPALNGSPVVLHNPGISSAVWEPSRQQAIVVTMGAAR
jgi:IrrE N-terminal-like domain